MAPKDALEAARQSQPERWHDKNGIPTRQDGVLCDPPSDLTCFVEHLWTIALDVHANLHTEESLTFWKSASDIGLGKAGCDDKRRSYKTELKADPSLIERSSDEIIFFRGCYKAHRLMRDEFIPVLEEKDSTLEYEFQHRASFVKVYWLLALGLFMIALTKKAHSLGFTSCQETGFKSIEKKFWTDLLAEASSSTNFMATKLYELQKSIETSTRSSGSCKQTKFGVVSTRVSEAYLSNIFERSAHMITSWVHENEYPMQVLPLYRKIVERMYENIPLLNKVDCLLSNLSETDALEELMKLTLVPRGARKLHLETTAIDDAIAQRPASSAPTSPSLIRTIADKVSKLGSNPSSPDLSRASTSLPSSSSRAPLPRTKTVFKHPSSSNTQSSTESGDHGGPSSKS